MTLTDEINVAPGQLLTRTFDDTQHPLVVHVGADGHFHGTFVQQKGTCDICVKLEGTRAKATLNGVYLAAENTALRWRVEHLADETYSEQKVYGVACHGAKVQFDGLIYVPFDKVRCTGMQNHQGLLLDDSAQITATPALEIYAEDVKCTHGATIGTLNDEQLFYLQTRGIPAWQARLMLISGFLTHILPPEKMPIVEKWMAQYVQK